MPKRVCSVRLEAAEWFRVYLTGFIIAEMVLIVLILVLPLGGRQDIDDVDDAGVCATPDCIRHAHVLGLLNRNEDGDSVPGPCDDFGKFVCSAARNRYGRIAADVVSQMILNWAASLMYEAPALSPKLDNFSKPAAMIQACTLCKGCGEASAKALVEFVANRTFGWPTVGDDHEGNPSRRYDSAVTLQALVELSVEWALPLWFRLELSTPSHLHGRRVFYILPSPMPSLWDGFHRDLLSVGDTYATYLGLFNDTILSMRKPPQHYSTFLTERSKDFQLEIFETLRETTEAAEPLFVELGQLHPILRNVRAGDWYRILQSVYNVSPPVSQRDLVFLSNGRLLTAIGNLFSTRTPTDIFYHTTWWFLQAMGPFASDAVFSFLNANPTGKLFLQTMCGVQLESLYYDSLAAVNKAKIPGDQRLAISIYLRNVRTVAAERIRSFDSINNTARDSLSNTLEKTVDFIWPEKDVEELERYHGWPNASLGDYFSQWISRSLHVHDSSNGSAPLDSRSKVYRLDGRHVTSYDPLSNVISVSVAALYSPLFYFNGTSAMTYGGLGFIYATEVLRALDTATLLGVGDGVLTPTNTTSLTGLQNAFACVNPVLAFPESPALRVAYEAYLRFRNVTTDLPLKGLANYSAEQIFFVTFCHTTCEFPESGYPESPRCTEAVMNFEPFLKAFNCRPDAKMNNATNCSINF